MPRISTTTTKKSLLGYLDKIYNLIAENKEVEIIVSGNKSKKHKVPSTPANKSSLKKLENLIKTKNEDLSLNEIKDEMKKISFSIEGTKVLLSHFDKQKSKSAKGGSKGRYTEVLSESFFCVYAAFCKKGGTEWNKFKRMDVPPFLEDAFTWDMFKKWISQNNINGLDLELNDSAFQTGYKSERKSFFLQHMKADGISFWHKALVKQAEKIKPYLTKNNYTFARADNIPDGINPYKVYTKYGDQLKKAIGFNRRLDGDKWNPGDVWIFVKGKMLTEKTLENSIEKMFSTGKKPLSRTLALKTVEKKEYTMTNPAIFNILNDEIYALVKSGDVIPVSLKKPGQAVYLKEMNDKNSVIKETFKFTGIKFLSTNIDVQLEFEINYKNTKNPKLTPSPSKITGVLKMKSFSGGLRLEIIFDNFSARMGSIGTENYSFIIYMTDTKGIKEIKKLRGEKKHNIIKKLGLPSMSGSDWFGGLHYKSLTGEKQKLLKNYVIDLYDSINSDKNGQGVLENKKDSKWIATKAAAGEIGLAIAGMNKNKAEEAVKSIFHLASSQGFYVPGENGKNIEILNSCYHIKLY